MRFKLRTNSDAEDVIISSMQDIGLEGAQIEDHIPLTAAEKEQMFVDIMPEEQPDDGTAVLSFYVEEDKDGTLKLGNGKTGTPEEICMGMKGIMSDLAHWGTNVGQYVISVDETEDIDWINNWKQYFHQFRIDDILCIPSWEKPEEKRGFVHICG
jgi:ribosomal protein L11 methyltransferase